jgi:tetratricopeptide (TPR) repeat protein
MMKTKLISMLVAIVFMLIGCAGVLQSGSLNDAYESYNAEKYEEALKKIRLAENLNKMTPELRAELTYLKAQTYEKMGRKNSAVTLYQYLKEQHPESQYGFLAAQILTKIEADALLITL